MRYGLVSCARRFTPILCPVRAVSTAGILLAFLASACASPVLSPISTPGRHETLAVARPCRPADLRPRLILQGATGSLLGSISLEFVGPTPCSLHGRPSLSFTGVPTGVRWRVVPIQPITADADLRPLGALRSLRQGDHVVIDLHWLNWCRSKRNEPVAPPKALVLELPAQAGSVRLRVPARPRCDAPRSQSDLRVGPFVAVSY